MIKKLTLGIASLGVVFSMMFGALVVAPNVHAQSSTEEACKALQEIDPTVTCAPGDEKAENTVVGVAKTAINILSIIVGIASVIVIVISGFRFVTSGGDPQGVSGARNGIIYAIVGLIIVILAQAIVAFVLNRL